MKAARAEIELDGFLDLAGSIYGTTDRATLLGPRIKLDITLAKTSKNFMDYVENGGLVSDNISYSFIRKLPTNNL